MKKYELTNNSKTVYGKKLFQIRALVDFGDVKAGSLGGYVEKEENLSQCGESWVYNNACVYDNACVYGNACVYNNARVYDNAWAYGDACVCGNARVCGDACVSDGTLWEAQTALCFRCKHLSDCAVPVLAADSSRDGRRLS